MAKNTMLQEMATEFSSPLESTGRLARKSFTMISTTERTQQSMKNQ